ncbi:MAG: magnesium transporter CorA family protein [Alphaproteobacteria bacterium]|nr:magnesium transporter CorA family protein [Alphaproteobacteria bacterium]
MITAYALSGGRLERAALGPSGEPPANAVWLDLLSPTKEEESAVQAFAGLDVPTREEMQEIEVSSRLYREGDAHFMTAPVIHHTDTARPEATPITFILSPNSLVTVRFTSPKSLDFFAARAARQIGWCTGAETILVGLLETIVDRVADVMERVASDLDTLSRKVFYDPAGGNGDEKSDEQATTDLQAVLRGLGRNGDLTSKTRDTILGLDRMATYLGAAEALGTRKDLKARLKTLSRDLRSLAEHDGFLSSKVNFLLDATLGMISIEQNRSMTEQNNIIKIFTVAATALLPPTLVASIYGMNFKWQPELQWDYGYIYALVLMVISAVIPYWYFKRRGWL